MKRFDDFIVYVDESGDHNLVKVDESYPVFVLAFACSRRNGTPKSARPP